MRATSYTPSMARTARRTWPRCLGSPISNVKRLTATRSRLVVTVADKMLTGWADRTRGPAAAQRDPAARRAGNLDAALGRGPGLGRLGRKRGLGQVLLRASQPADRPDQLLHHRLGADPALADRRVQPGYIGVAQVTGQGDQRVGGGQPLQRQPLLAHGPGDLVLARLDRGFAALLGEPLPDLVPGPGALHELEPVPARSGLGRLGGEDLHRVAV